VKRIFAAVSHKLHDLPMTIEEAKSLISPATISQRSSQQWADLGCGSGTFSYALASLLPEASNIICVDKETQAIDPVYKNNSLQFKKADIQQVNFDPGTLSGVLIANALHYIKNQEAFIERVNKFLRADATWIIVEYDTTTSNRWVPYPVSFNRLEELYKSYGEIIKLNERASAFGQAMLYACQVQKQADSK
jgi:ubiquinone/menaquinone biosynthesis C-methylase UbiE